jgi:hypothetical protein
MSPLRTAAVSGATAAAGEGMLYLGFTHVPLWAVVVVCGSSAVIWGVFG